MTTIASLNVKDQNLGYNQAILDLLELKNCQDHSSDKEVLTTAINHLEVMAKLRYPINP